MWDAYRRILADGKLDEHVCVLWAAGATLDSARAALAQIQSQPTPPASLGDGRLLSCGAKIFMDGSGGARTAWVFQDWNKNFNDTDHGNTGYPITPPQIYRQQVRLFQRAGVHIGTHAIGDRAIDFVLDTYAGNFGPVHAQRLIPLKTYLAHGIRWSGGVRQHPHSLALLHRLATRGRTLISRYGIAIHTAAPAEAGRPGG